MRSDFFVIPLYRFAPVAPNVQTHSQILTATLGYYRFVPLPANALNACGKNHSHLLRESEFSPVNNEMPHYAKSVRDHVETADDDLFHVADPAKNALAMPYPIEFLSSRLSNKLS